MTLDDMRLYILYLGEEYSKKEHPLEFDQCFTIGMHIFDNHIPYKLEVFFYTSRSSPSVLLKYLEKKITQEGKSHLLQKSTRILLPKEGARMVWENLTSEGFNS
jgi:hypothetical protein